MKKLLIIILLSTTLSGCLFYKTDDGLSFFKPYYMSREREVSELDLRIIKKAKAILRNENNWNKNDDRLCFHDEKWSLFCALAKASVELGEKYKHRRVAMQETRITINDNYSYRWTRHQLMDFNNHQSTNFEDIKRVLNETLRRLEIRFEKQKHNNTLKQGRIKDMRPLA